MVKRFALLVLFVLATSLVGAAMLRRLAEVRAEARATDAVLATPMPQAGSDAASVLRRLAEPGVAVGVVPIGDGRARVMMIGPEQALQRAIARIERGPPAVRFAPWRIASEPGAGDRLRFDAVAMAAAR